MNERILQFNTFTLLARDLNFSTSNVQFTLSVDNFIVFDKDRKDIDIHRLQIAIIDSCLCKSAATRLHIVYKIDGLELRMKLEDFFISYRRIVMYIATFRDLISRSACFEYSSTCIRGLPVTGTK